MSEKDHNNILLILRDAETSSILSEILLGAGFQVEIADNANTALDRAVELLPAIIVLEDTQELNGLDICRHLRNRQILDGIPIVMLVGRGDNDELAMGLSAGVDDFLPKPVETLEVLARLRSLARFNSNRYLITDLTRFSWMAEYAHEGYLMLDRSGAIHYANERALNLLNMPEDFFGLPFVNVVERHYLPEPQETWKSWMEDPSPCFLVQPETPTARAVWVVLEALDPPEHAEYMRVVRLRDVTERMSIFQDMRRFHTVVAHKLRTPMSMLMMSITILKNQMEQLPPEEIKKMLQTAIKGTDRLATEIRSILTYIDSPLALNVGSPMKLGEISELLKIVSIDLKTDKIMFSMAENLSDIKIAMTTDAFEMILQELIGNSRKFHPNHTPSIDIYVGQTESDFIQVRVIDDGLTLSAEQLQWAWLPYFQGEKDFTGELPGLGLGFPMVATMVWKAGGGISLRNRGDGPGVIVDLKIPLESTMRRVERPATPFQS